MGGSASNPVLQLTDPVCHDPGYTIRDNCAAAGRAAGRGRVVPGNTPGPRQPGPQLKTTLDCWGKAVTKPTFEDVAQLIADTTGVHPSQITPIARLEKDLGITGDDGLELLEVLAERFGTDFDRPNHGRRYLFHPEGFDIFAILGLSSYTVIPITVSDIHLAVVRGHWEDPPSSG